MDCPCEEQLIRMKLQPFAQVRSLAFDLAERTLRVRHIGSTDALASALDGLRLDARLISSAPAAGEHANAASAQAQTAQRKLLWAVLGINFLFFIVEMGSGLLAKSMGLVADSLDMLADSIVYGLALWAVGAGIARKNRVAKTAGWIQMLLAALGFIEVLKRFFGWDGVPDFRLMIAVSLLALAANVLCLYLLQKSRSREAHMQAGMIFTSNDIIINAGVALAGVLVLWLGSPYPDLIIGAVVFVVVAKGAVKILKLAADG